MAQGLRGKWDVHTYKYKGTGPFHIWPANPPPPLPIATAIPVAKAVPVADSEASAPPPEDLLSLPMGYVASDNNECVICFERGVNTVLRPCGHIAMCSTCAVLVNESSRTVWMASGTPAPHPYTSGGGGACPICRTTITSIEEIQPTSFAASAPPAVALAATP